MTTRNTDARKILAALMPLESEVVIVCELLRDLGRCQEVPEHPRFGKGLRNMFKFEDDSIIRFGILGPYAAA